MLFTLKYTFYKKKYQPSLQNVPLPDGFPSATTRAWPPTTNYEVPSMLRVRTYEMTGLFPPGRQAQVQTSSLLRLQSETYIVRKSPSTECWECFFVIPTIPPALVHVPFSHSLLWSGSTWLNLPSDPWRRSGSAVECRTLDREDTVTNPLHIFGSLMTTRCAGVTPRQNTIIEWMNHESRFIAKYKYNYFVLSWRNNATTSRHQRRQCVGDSWRCSLDRESGILPLSHCTSMYHCTLQ